MKIKHTTQKSANRGFDKNATGYPNEQARKEMNVKRYSPDKRDKRFTNPTPKRKKQ